MTLFKDVNVVYVHVKDWEASRKFYRETLQWPVCWSDENIGWEEYGVEGATHVAVNRWMGEGECPSGTGVICVLSVESCSATKQALEARGVRCGEIMSIPNVVTFGSFYDPEGNELQFAGGA